MEEKPQGAYVWENDFQKAWESGTGDVREQAFRQSINLLRQSMRRKCYLREGQERHYCLLRHVVIVLDLCKRMKFEKDFRPNRLTCTINLLKNFVDNYLGINPIGQIGIVTMALGRSENLCYLTSDPEFLKESLSTLVDGTIKAKKKYEEASATFMKDTEQCESNTNIEYDENDITSFQSGLDRAIAMLQFVPDESSKEIILITSSLSSCDKGNNIHSTTIPRLITLGISCECISFDAECFILKHLSQQTSPFANKEKKRGHYVLTDRSQFQEILEHIANHSARTIPQKTFLKIGHPECIMNCSASSCRLHAFVHSNRITDEGDERCALWKTNTGYECPICYAIHCKLPVECRVCGLALVSGEHIARSYQQVSATIDFTETKLKDDIVCFACDCKLNKQNEQTHGEINTKQAFYCLTCPKCKNVFCAECESIIKCVLHLCPGCISTNVANSS